jgi:hypothetical protein
MHLFLRHKDLRFDFYNIITVSIDNSLGVISLLSLINQHDVKNCDVVNLWLHSFLTAPVYGE